MNAKLESLGRVEIHVCPNLCGTSLTTTAHVMQEWYVDAEGNFVEVAADCLEVTHEPDNGNAWTCDGCGKEALLVEAEKYQLAIQKDDCRFVTDLYVPLSDKLQNDIVLNGNFCEPVRIDENWQFVISDDAPDDEKTIGVLLELNAARRYLRVLGTKILEEESF